MASSEEAAGSGPDLTVVVPTRDRLPLLQYCLRSLEYQRPADGFDVVLVDDGSCDGTEEWLSGYRPPYPLRRIRLCQARGRAAARNVGLAAADGAVVLFMDGDVLAPPRLVATHRRLHAGGGPTCVTGHPWVWRSVYTWRFADFTPAQHGVAGEGRPGPLLDPRLLGRWEAFERWAGGPLAQAHTPLRVAPPHAAPFLWCVTRGVSIPRRLAERVGGFCEAFRGYGLEDWEFGYRLARAGTRFLAHPDAAVWHQEHPPRERHPSDLQRNYRVFLEHHPDFEVGYMAVCPPWLDPDRYARGCRVYARLREVAPTVAGALRDAALAWARAWSASDGRGSAPDGWTVWCRRWGAERTERLLQEQLRVLGDPQARAGVVLLQRLTGLSAP